MLKYSYIYYSESHVCLYITLKRSTNFQYFKDNTYVVENVMYSRFLEFILFKINVGNYYFYLVFKTYNNNDNNHKKLLYLH